MKLWLWVTAMKLMMGSNALEAEGRGIVACSCPADTRRMAARLPLSAAAAIPLRKAVEKLSL